MTAESLYEAAITGVHLLRQDRWADSIAPGTPITIEVAAPATTHTVTVAQLRSWAEATAISPGELLKKRKLLELIKP